MSKINIKFVLVIILTLVLGSCGPFYRTKYNYIPPSNHNGLICINQCISEKSMCGNNCSNQSHSCQYLKEVEAQNEYNEYIRQNCHEAIEYYDYQQNPGPMNRNTYGGSKKQIKCKDPFPKKLSDFRKTYECESDNRNCMNSCDNLYNDCYTNCGGRIEVTQEEVRYY